MSSSATSASTKSARSTEDETRAVSLATVDNLAQALLREYMSRKGYTKTLAMFDEESPRNEDTISRRSVIAKQLNLEKMAKRNKELGEEAFSTFLEMLVASRCQQKADKSGTASTTQGTKEKSTRKRDSMEGSTGTAVTDTRLQQPQQQLQQNQQQSQQQPVVRPKSALKKSSTDNSQPTVQKTVRVIEPNFKNSSNIDKEALITMRKREEMSPRALDRSAFANSNNNNSATANMHHSLRAESPRHPVLLSGSSSSSGARLYANDTDTTPPPPPPSRLGFRSSDIVGSSYDDEDEDDEGQRVQMRPAYAAVAKGSFDMVMIEDVLEDVDEDFGYSNNSSLKSALSKNPPNNGSGISTRSLGAVIGFDTARVLKKVILGDSRFFMPSWLNQGFTFARHHNLKYGLVQREGGPCGVLAVVQSFILKEFLYSKEKRVKGFPNPSVQDQQLALALALCNILWNIGDCKQAKLVISGAIEEHTNDVPIHNFKVIVFMAYDALLQSTTAHIKQFQGPYGVILFMLSAVLTRGVDELRGDVDTSFTSLIVEHGFCSQELVNLMLVGRAYSNVFDGTVRLEAHDGSKDVQILRGIPKQSQIGFLSLMEKFGHCKVGENLKSPMYPIWIVCSESHYSVLFEWDQANNGSFMPRSLKAAMLGGGSSTIMMFDLFYYDYLASQEEEIRLTITTSSGGRGVGSTAAANGDDYDDSSDLIPPLNHCIRTKWIGASVDWNDTEPLL